MKRLQTYILLLPTLFFIILGAALPYLTSQIQDAKISALQKKLELSAVNLTLRQEDDVGPVLQLMSAAHSENPWDGETVLDKADASQAALAVVETMEQYGLLPEGDLKRFRKTEGYAQPQLLMGVDGRSALIWTCTWNDIPETILTLDDATGKAVRILLGVDPTDSGTVESTHFRLEKWTMFLQDYYGFGLTDIVCPADSMAIFDLCFASKDSTALYDLKLEIEYNWDFFNYQ